MDEKELMTPLELGYVQETEKKSSYKVVQSVLFSSLS